MKIFKNDFDKVYEDADIANSIFLLEEILEEARVSKIMSSYNSIQDKSLKDLFENTPNGLGIKFVNIVSVSNTNITDQNKADLISFWTTIKYLIESKPGQDGNQSAVPWLHRLNNQFFKPYLSEEGILQAANSGEYPALAKLGLQYHSEQLFKDAHHYLFEGRGVNLPDFSSKVGYSFDCKGKNSSNHGSDFVIYYNAKYTNNEGSFYFKTTKASLDGLLANEALAFAEEEKNFLISICGCNGKEPFQTVSYKINNLEININNHIPIFDLMSEDKNKNSFDTSSISDPKLKALADQYIKLQADLLAKYSTYTLGSIKNYYIYDDNFLNVPTDNINHFGVKDFIDQVNEKARIAADLKNNGVDISTLKRASK